MFHFLDLFCPQNMLFQFLGLCFQQDSLLLLICDLDNNLILVHVFLVLGFFGFVFFSVGSLLISLVLCVFCVFVVLFRFFCFGVLIYVGIFSSMLCWLLSLAVCYSCSRASFYVDRLWGSLRIWPDGGNRQERAETGEESSLSKLGVVVAFENGVLMLRSITCPVFERNDVRKGEKTGFGGSMSGLEIGENAHS